MNVGFQDEELWRLLDEFGEAELARQLETLLPLGRDQGNFIQARAGDHMISRGSSIGVALVLAAIELLEGSPREPATYPARFRRR